MLRVVTVLGESASLGTLLDVEKKIFARNFFSITQKSNKSLKVLLQCSVVKVRVLIHDTEQYILSTYWIHTDILCVAI